MTCGRTRLYALNFRYESRDGLTDEQTALILAGNLGPLLKGFSSLNIYNVRFHQSIGIETGQVEVHPGQKSIDTCRPTCLPLEQAKPGCERGLLHE